MSININWHVIDSDLFAELLYNVIYDKEPTTETDPNLEKIWRSGLKRLVTS